MSGVPDTEPVPDEPWARRDHTHQQPAMPRWVRYLAVLVALVTALVIGLAVVLYRQAGRIDALEEYVGQRSEQRDAERAEDLQRERLLICDLLLSLPVRSPQTQGMVGRLECPPPGDPAYSVIGEPPRNR
jgi:hypothetical protein